MCDGLIAAQERLDLLSLRATENANAKSKAKSKIAKMMEALRDLEQDPVRAPTHYLLVFVWKQGINKHVKH
jgi:hypothetical protein